MVKGLNTFSLEFHKKIGAGSGNRFSSPLSIATVLAMAYEGADGPTAGEIHKTLHLGLERGKVPAAFSQILSSLDPAKKTSGFQLAMANRLFVARSYPIRRDFRKTLRDYYRATAKRLNFRKRRVAAKAINDWVKKKTHQRIKEIVPASSISSSTRLVLANAIYFKGKWKKKFKKKETRKRVFYLTKSKKTQVETMYQKAYLGYCAVGNVELLEKRYKGTNMAMVVVLPKRKDGLARLEKSLTQTTLARWMAKLKTRKVRVYLPKFKFKWGGSLKEHLKALGIKTPFDSAKANFRAISKRAASEGLYIAKVFHKSFVAVDEKGTEAAAATAASMDALMADMDTGTPEFVADHPFLFLIRNRKTGVILFIGRVTAP